MKHHLVSTCVTILCLAIHSCVAAHSPASPMQTIAEPPPRELSGSEFGLPFLKSSDSKRTMRAIYNSQTPKLFVVSNYLDGDGRTGKSTRSFALEYWPTCVAELDNGVLLVAGKVRSTGCTRIEAWRFSEPTVTNIPAAGPVVIECGEPRDVDEVYLDRVPNHELVRKAIRLFGPHPGALIQFADSRDVYTLTLDTGAVTILASPSQVTSQSLGCLHAPLLATMDFAASGQLVQGGYVYYFSTAVPPVTGPSRWLLRDANRDSVIESQESLTEAEWTARGWNDLSNWVP